ncbi:hypothetical protein RH831_08870 [Halodesulfurarchaeum sp. HSR-GB]|uniref:hypothetical protein n=1 Tax=Halodesulfurarchaeum TaxID=1980514 RepID=UPI0009033E16|nr:MULTISPECIES: hypothetical protein [Halodesulfurarchaeum]MDR5657291.1 hypothetical protein [Halodesulfurarchaeum sp. HSR-GB]
MNDWKDGLLGGGALGVLADVTLNGADLIFGSFDLVMGSVDLLYPAMAVLARIAPDVGWLDQALVTDLLVVIAILYLVHLINRLRQRLKNDRA